MCQSTLLTIMVSSLHSTIVGMAQDYDCLLSMAIATLTLEKVQELCTDRDKLQKDVEDLRKATPKSLWLKDLDDVEIQLDEQDRADQEDEAAKVRKGKVKGEPCKRKQAPKNPWKINKKEQIVETATKTSGTASSSAMETENVPAVAKPKGRGGSRKAKKDDSSDDDDFGIPDLRDRLAKYNLDSSPNNSAIMETEVHQVPAGKKESSEGAATRKKPAASLSEIYESISEIEINEEDLQVIEEAAPVAGNNGGRKPSASSEAAKPSAAAKKRGPAASKQAQQQKLLTEMLKPAEDSGNSPDKKVGKMRASPCNKKSGFVLGRVGGGVSKEIEAIDSEETFGSTSMSENSEEVSKVVPTRFRPQRTNWRQTRYVISDSETDNGSDIVIDDSDFEEDED